MAVEANNKIFPGAGITPTDFAVQNEFLSSIESGILNGVLVTGSGNTLTVSSGYMLLLGRIVEVKGGTLSVTLPSTATTYVLYARMDLSNNGSVVDFLTCVDGSMPSTTEDCNLVNGQCYMVIAYYKADSTGITGVYNRALEKSGNSNWNGKGTYPNHANFKVTSAKTWTDVKYNGDVISVDVEPGIWYIESWAWVKGISGGTGTSAVRAYNKTTNQSIRTSQQQHSVNEEICINVNSVITVNKTSNAHDCRNYKETLALQVYTTTANRTIGHCGIRVFRIR